MREPIEPHESLPDHPPITLRGLLVVAAMLAALPAALFAIAHPTAVAASLLVFGAVAAAVARP